MKIQMPKFNFKMPKLRKPSKKLLMAVSMIACAVLLVVGSVMGTYAYLTAQATILNKYTYGKVSLTLDETQISTVDGITALETRSIMGNQYKLISGQTYTKDPQIKLGTDAEPCFLYVKVVNQIASIEIAGAENASKTIAGQMESYGWKLLDGYTDVFVYCGNAETYYNASPNEGQAVLIRGSSFVNPDGPVIYDGVLFDDAKPIHVFDSFTVEPSMDVAALEAKKGSTVTITAYAIGASSFIDAAGSDPDYTEVAKDAFDEVFGTT